jgi:hypothetical protein
MFKLRYCPNPRERNESYYETRNFEITVLQHLQVTIRRERNPGGGTNIFLNVRSHSESEKLVNLKGVEKMKLKLII